MSAPETVPRIRAARADEAKRIGEIARAAYTKYIPRIGREPPPMVADFAAEIAAGRIVVIAAGDAVAGYMIGWPQADGYFIDNIAVDPAGQGHGFGRRLMDHAEREARRHGLAAIRLYTNAAMTEKSVALSPPGVRRDPSRDRAGIQPRLHAARPSERRHTVDQAPLSRRCVSALRRACLSCSTTNGFCSQGRSRHGSSWP